VLWVQLIFLANHSTAWPAVLVVTGELIVGLGCRLIYREKIVVGFACVFRVA
jgi:hypothetical protein